MVMKCPTLINKFAQYPPTPERMAKSVVVVVVWIVSKCEGCTYTAIGNVMRVQYMTRSTLLGCLVWW